MTAPRKSAGRTEPDLIRDEIWRCLENLRAAGQSILVIDKNVAALTRIADRHYISGANDFSTQLGYAYTIPGLPATFGIEIEKRF